ncbi:MAG: DUF1289 domain-containing protein [Pseudomonadales bacterium]
MPITTYKTLSCSCNIYARTKRSMTSKSNAVASPCVRNCTLDNNDVCMGCYRTLREIYAWSLASGSEKREILRLANERWRASRLPLSPSQ